MKEYIINEYITLKMKYNKTYIYIKDQKFSLCISLLVQFPKEDVSELEQKNSIDEACEGYNSLYDYRFNRDITKLSISPEEEFWGHCSNMEAWTELNYDSRILDCNLSFPLLKKLTEVGDDAAKKVFKKEIIKRLKSGEPIAVRYLILRGYLEYLDQNEKRIVFTHLNKNLEEIVCSLFKIGQYCLISSMLKKLIRAGDNFAKEIYDDFIFFLHYI